MTATALDAARRFELRQRATERPRVVIIGGGFGGLEAARALADEPVDVVLIDKRNHHLFQPLLYQVATAGLGATDIATPIRKILASQPNVSVLLGEVTAIDAASDTLRTKRGDIAYDFLIVATGLTNHYFGHPEWEPYAPGLKSLHDALDIRRRVLLAYEAAEATDDPDLREELLTFVVVGGGPTGVELAGALAEIGRHTMARNFRRIDPTSARVILVEGGDRVLAGFDADLSERALRRLHKIGVETEFGRFVSHIDEHGVVLGGAERIRARTVLWGAGVGGRGLVETIGGASLDRMGRVFVDPDLRIAARDGSTPPTNVFAIGDIAHFDDAGEALPGVAQVALQQGRHAAGNIVALSRGRTTKAFAYKDLGSMATIGRSAAVAQIGEIRTVGFVAWVMWIFVHVMGLVGFRNRVVVLLNWAMAYIFWTRAARIILERPLGDTPEPIEDLDPTHSLRELPALDPAEVARARAAAEADDTDDTEDADDADDAT